MKPKEQPKPIISLLRKVTVKDIDITLSQVSFGKRTGYQTNWFATGKDMNELMEEHRQRRLDHAKQCQGWRFRLSDYETFGFYFPTSTGEVTASKHFSKMLEAAPNTNFEKL